MIFRQCHPLIPKTYLPFNTNPSKICIIPNLDDMRKSITRILIFAFGFTSIVFAAPCYGQDQKDNSVAISDKLVNYELPKTYELMQVALSLTDKTIVSNGYNVYNEVIDTNSTYYKEVQEYFGQYKNHPLITELNKSLSKSASNYIYNLHRSYNSVYDKGQVKKDLKYPLAHRLAYHFNSVKRKVLDDFAKISNFDQFYNQHKELYKNILNEVKLNANVNEQQNWLEQEFSSRHNSYSIVISPLMNNTHFTKRFEKQGKNNCLMWVSRFEFDRNLSKTLNSAYYTGVVMTEIDHNYVNPVSDKYKKELNELMGENNRSKWTGGSASNSYQSGFKVFNEYMTHAVYLLFTRQKLTPEEQQIIETSKIDGMNNRRKFIKFDLFYEKLGQLYDKRNPGETLTELYPQIIEWCRTENTK